MQTKICRTCKKELDLSFFNKDKNGKYGVRGSCIECTKKGKDQEKILNRMRDYKKQVTKDGDTRYWKRRASVSNYRAKSLYNILSQVTGEQLMNKFENNPYCVYCEESFRNHIEAKIEHVIPLAKGGIHTIQNIEFACGRCNSSKNDKDEKEFFEYIEKLYNNLKYKYK